MPAPSGPANFYTLSMPTTRSQLIEAFKNYQTSFAEEQRFIADFLSLLKSNHCYHRNHLPGHITGSAWITDESLSRVILVHHAKLNKWLQPGGHADGDKNILNVAWREAVEETGIQQFKLLTNLIFDIDIHTIPAHNNFPEHLHYDIRFAFQASRQSLIKVSSESHDVQWIPLDQVPLLSQNNASILRMIQKTISR
jgi:8-oxo-dGTP pyrophosphatase MutT (NUDIX family)